MPPLKTYEIVSNSRTTNNTTNEYGRPSSSSSSTTDHETTTISSSNNNNNNYLNNINNNISNKNYVNNKGTFICGQYADKLLQNLHSLREDSRFCDVEIIAGNTVFNAHRAVLSASSAYFEAMFRPEFDLKEGKQKSVIIQSIDSTILKMLLDFIYTGRILITQSNVQELLATADMLQLNEVVEGCCDFLCRELHASNALGILRFSEAHHCEQLTESAITFIHANFPQIALEDELLDIPETLLSRLLTSELLRVDSEYQVFQAALRWIKYDIDKRRQYVFNIFSQVRLSLVPTILIEAAIKECHDTSLNVALRSIVHDLVTKRGQLVSLRVYPRIGAKKCIYIFGGAKREPTNCWNPADSVYDTVEKFDIFLNEWIVDSVQPMNYGRIQPGVATIGNKIYVIGGERGSQILANGECYDPQNNKWTIISPMIVPRCEFGLCTVGGTLYAVGGWFGVDIGGSMECYDPVKDTWSMIGELPEPRFSMGVVSFEGLIYIVGGCSTTSRHLADLICFNPVTQEWHQLASMQTARCQLGIALLDRHLYVIGGIDKHQEVLRNVERYSFDDDKWEVISPMLAKRASPAVTAIDGLLYVAGGDQSCEVNFYRAQITLSSVECYDPLTDTWRQCPNLPSSRSEAGAIAI